MSARFIRSHESSSVCLWEGRRIAGCMACFLILGLPLGGDASALARTQSDEGRETDGEAPEIDSVRLEGVCSAVLGQGDYVFLEAGSLPRVGVSATDDQGLAKVELVGPSNEILDRYEMPEGTQRAVCNLSLGEGGWDRSVSIVVSDRAGNRSTWSLGPIGDGEPDVPLEIACADGTHMLAHPRKVLATAGKPSVSLVGVEDGATYQERREVRLEVTSEDLWMVRECDPDRVVASVRHETWDGDVTTREVRASDLALRDASLGRYECVLAADADGRWTVEAQVRGASGACSEQLEESFVVDSTPPVVRVSFEDGEADRVVGHLRTARVEVVEGNFDPALVRLDTTGVAGDWQEGEGEAHLCTVSFSQEGEQSLRVLARDCAGNEATAAVDPFRIDLTKPQISTPVIEGTPSGIFDGGHVLFLPGASQVSAGLSDEVGLSSVSSVGSLAWRTKLEPGGLSSAAEALLVGGTHVGTGAGLEVRDLAGNSSRWSLGDGLLSIDGRRFRPDEVIVDDTTPVVALEGPSAGSYLSEPARVDVRAWDDSLTYIRRYDPTQTVLEIRRQLGGTEEVTRYPLLAFAGDASSEDTFLAVDLEQDGRYGASARLVDPAGNVQRVALGEFVLDRTPPQVEVVYDGPELVDGVYCPGERTASILIREWNFDPALVDISTSGEVGAWVSEGDMHRVVVRFGEGEHHLSVSSRDLAGNESIAYEGEKFVVDEEPPTVEFDGVSDACAYPGVVAPTIRLTDAVGLREDGVSWHLVGARSGEVEATPAISLGDRDATIAFEDLGHVPESDDVYTLSVSASDLAGNISQEEVTFSVNRFGSTFRVEGIAGHGEVVAEAPDVTIEEINVSGAAMSDHAVSVTHGTETRELQRSSDGDGTGFVLEQREEGGWSVARYLIPAANFVGDGTYHVVASSRDWAGNNNLSADYFDREEGQRSHADASFVLDTTPPIVNGFNIESGAAYRCESYLAHFAVADNVGIDFVSVLLDGSEVDAREVGSGVYEFEIDSLDGQRRTVEVSATDVAGHVTRAGIEGILVSNETSGESVSGAMQGKMAQAVAAWVGAAGIAGAFLGVARRLGLRGRG